MAQQSGERKSYDGIVVLTATEKTNKSTSYVVNHIYCNDKCIWDKARMLRTIQIEGQQK